MNAGLTQKAYPNAMLVTADMNFSISHSVPHKEMAFKCRDCHGRNGWVLNWNQLGYAKDPRKGNVRVVVRSPSKRLATPVYIRVV